MRWLPAKVQDRPESIITCGQIAAVPVMHLEA